MANRRSYFWIAAPEMHCERKDNKYYQEAAGDQQFVG
jgi:hypothetical protein